MKKKMISFLLIATTVCSMSGCSYSFSTDIGSYEPPVILEGDAAVIADIPTTQEFTEEPVAEADLKQILLAGVNAPSAMNGQPWHFSAVTDRSVLQKIAEGMGGGMPPKGGMPPTGKDGGPGSGNPPAGQTPDCPGNAPAGQTPDGSGNAPVGQTPDGSGNPPAPPAGGMPAGSGAKAGVADAPVAVIISCRDGSDFDAGLACESMADMANVLGYGTKILSSPTMALNGENKEEYRKLLEIPEDQSAVAVLLIGHAKEPTDSVSGATERNPFDEVVSMIGGATVQDGTEEAEEETKASPDPADLLGSEIPAGLQKLLQYIDYFDFSTVVKLAKMMGYSYMGGLTAKAPGTDLMLGMIRDPDGDLMAVLRKSGETTGGSFVTEDAKLADGRAYTRLKLSGAEFGYHFAVNDKETSFLVDSDGSVYEAQDLDEGSAMSILEEMLKELKGTSR